MGGFGFRNQQHSKPHPKTSNKVKMSANEGRQSPDPERSTGAQQNDAPSDGHGVNQGSNNQDQSKKDLENLESNPKGPLDDHAAATVSKTVDNAKANSKN